MRRLPTCVILAFLSPVLLAQTLAAYDIPQRRIDLKPYMHVMIPSDLLKYADQTSRVEDDAGIGFGLKARTQITQSWGFAVNTSLTDVSVTDNSMSTAAIFTAGFYYTRSTSLGDFFAHLAYGAISVADNSATLFLPGLEYNRAVSERASISVEVSMPVANDWFHDFGIEENFASLSLSIGAVFLF